MNRTQFAGIYFGYPSCCIKSFSDQPEWERSLIQKSVHENHGFIPCYECALKIVNKETTLKDLITNRICQAPFPDKGSKTKFDKFMSEATTLKHPGEDIRAAKAIYEMFFGECTEVNVKAWMENAKEVMDHLGVKTIQEAAEKLDIHIEKLK